MAEKIPRSHRARVKVAKYLIENDTQYKQQRISIVDREAFVECLLLEDIVTLYEKRMREEKAHNPTTSAGLLVQKKNIEKFSAIINIFNAAVDVSRAAIGSGDYAKVWKAIHEGALMAAASSVKQLPALKKMAIEMLRDLCDDADIASAESGALDNEVSELEKHEKNVELVRGLSPSADTIEDVIRAVEAAIPDTEKSSRLNANV